MKSKDLCTQIFCGENKKGLKESVIHVISMMSGLLFTYVYAAKSRQTHKTKSHIRRYIKVDLPKTLLNQGRPANTHATDDATSKQTCQKNATGDAKSR